MSKSFFERFYKHSCTHPLGFPLSSTKRGGSNTLFLISSPLFVKQRGVLGGEFRKNIVEMTNKIFNCQYLFY
jgi:hypothetical protein